MEVQSDVVLQSMHSILNYLMVPSQEFLVTKLIDHATNHPIVQYGDDTDRDNDYWFTDQAWWDQSIGNYFLSFKFTPYLFIATYVITTLTLWTTAWMSYELYWCSYWDLAEGKGR